MDLTSVVAAFVNASGYALAAFIILVGVDLVVGIVSAVVKKEFDLNYLPSFLETSLGVRFGVIVLSAYLGTNSATGTSAHDAALAVVTAGGGAMSLSLLKDIIVKVMGFAKPKSTTPVK